MNLSINCCSDQDKKSNNLDKDEGDTSNELENAWTAHKTETGAVYYYNSITGKSTYQKPSNFKGEVAIDQATLFYFFIRNNSFGDLN